MFLSYFLTHTNLSLPDVHRVVNCLLNGRNVVDSMVKLKTKKKIALYLECSNYKNFHSLIKIRTFFNYFFSY